MTEQALRDYLNSVNKGESSLVVTGHPAPDADAVVSALFEAWRRTLRGTAAKPLVQAESLPREVVYLLGALAERVPLGSVKVTDTLVLTDHHDVGAYPCAVAAVVDHHPRRITDTWDVADAEIVPVGAATTLVARRIRRDGYVPDAFCARILLGAILLDTEGLSPHKAKEEDRELALWLSALCGENAAALYKRLQSELLSESDVNRLFWRDYRRYTDAAGAPQLGFAILKVWADALPDRQAVRRLLAEDVRSGYVACVAKIMLYLPEGGREEYYLAVGDGAEAVLSEVQAVGGADARRTAEDEVYLPVTCVHRGRKWYAARLTEIFAKNPEK